MPLELTGLCPLVQVFDMPEALAFYRDRLGFAVIHASPEIDTPEGRLSHWCWLRLGGADLMLNTAYDEGERPATRDAARQAAHRDTELYFSCPDVDAVHDALAAAGVACDPPAATPYGMQQLWLADPDGYRLCFQTLGRP